MASVGVPDEVAGSQIRRDGMGDAVGRQNYILEVLQEHGSVRVSALAERLGVSTMTIRRDLARLAEEGPITLVHGGARLERSALFEYDIATKDMRHLEEKAAIGLRCAELVEDGMAIFFDAGTSINHVARALTHGHSFTAITGSLRVESTLAGVEGVNLIMAPGEFHPGAMGVIGQMTDDFTTQFHYDIVFLSANGIDLEHGLSVAGPIDAASKRCLLDCASEVVAVLDHSKFDRKQFTRICGLDRLDAVVTDSGLDTEAVKRYRAAGVNVIVAEMPKAE